MKRRLNVVGILRNERGEYLLTRKPAHLGVYAGTWGLPGGGVEEYETIEQAFMREMKEEVGCVVRNVCPLYFADDTTEKLLEDGSVEAQYLVFLYFTGEVDANAVNLNHEHDLFEWVSVADLGEFEVNRKTEEIFVRMGVI